MATRRTLFRTGESLNGETVTLEALRTIVEEEGLPLEIEHAKGGRARIILVVGTPPGSRLFTREPILHSAISGMLPTRDPRHDRAIFCRLCGRPLHAKSGRILATWYDTEFGEFCAACFLPGDVLETLEDAIGPEGGENRCEPQP